MGGHTLEYQGVVTSESEETTSVAALVRVDGGVVHRPAMNQFRFSGSGIGTPSVATSLTEDVFLTLLELPEDDTGPVIIRVVLQPLVTWLWIGGGVPAFGTALAAVPDRRRRDTDPHHRSGIDTAAAASARDRLDDPIDQAVAVR